MNGDYRQQLVSLQDSFRLLLALREEFPQIFVEHFGQLSALMDISDLETRDDLLETLPRLSSVIDTAIELTVGNGFCELSPNVGKKLQVAIPWSEQEENFPVQLFGDELREYSELGTQLSQQNVLTDADILFQRLRALRGYGLNVQMIIRLDVDKKIALQKLNLPQEVNYILYLSSEEFANQLEGQPIFDVADWFDLRGKSGTVILLADRTSSFSNKYTSILGLGDWAKCLVPFQTETEKKLLVNILAFHERQTETPLSQKIIPDQFYMDTPILHERIFRIFARVRQCVCVLLLSHSSQLDGLQFNSEIIGDRISHVLLPSTPSKEYDEGELFPLYEFAFESLQSDKLEIVRRSVGLYLEDTSALNLSKLLSSKDKIFETAKANFSMYLSSEIKKFFEYRGQLISETRDFVVDTENSLELISEQLLSNVAKVSAFILTLFSASILRPDISFQILEWSGIALILYMLVVLIMQYRFFASFLNRKYRLRDTLEDVTGFLTSSEVRKIEGEAFKRASKTFTCFLVIITFIYQLPIWILLFLYKTF